VKPCDVIVAGDLIADFIMPIPHLPVYADQHQPGHQFWLELGGACNVLVAAAHLGLRTRAVGAVGDDCYGRRVTELLHENGTDICTVWQETGTTTPLTLVLIDDSGRHVFLGIPGSATELPAPDSWPHHLHQARALYANGYACGRDEARASLLAGFQEARRRQTLTFFDPGPEVARIDGVWLKTLLQSTDCLQLTLEEATVLAGLGAPARVAAELLTRGPGLVAIKMGPEGCFLATATEQVRIAAFPAPVRDTTGAGDAFDAACICGCLAGYSLGEIGWLGNAYGAAACTVVGAGRCIPDASAVMDILYRAGISFPPGTRPCCDYQEALPLE
jgi:2-dehydro-3-deoxygluconokinase